MADQANPSTAAPTSNGLATANQSGQGQPGGGASFNVPDGYVLARKDEHESYRRQAEQYNGVKPYYEKGSKYGLKSAEDFDRFGPVLETLNKRGIDPRQLAAMLSGEADDETEQAKQRQFDPEKFREEIRGEFRRESAVKEWTDLSAKEKDHVDAALKEFYGEEEVDGWTRAMHTRAANHYLNEIREEYPKGHPLHGEYLQPIGESHRAKLVEYMKAERAKHSGEAMRAKADAAIRQKPNATSAGNSGGQGKPKQEPSVRKSVTEDISDAIDGILPRVASA